MRLQVLVIEFVRYSAIHVFLRTTCIDGGQKSFHEKNSIHMKVSCYSRVQLYCTFAFSVQQEFSLLS
jgi:hypothetical protein